MLQVPRPYVLQWINRDRDKTKKNGTSRYVDKIRSLATEANSEILWLIDK